MRWAWFGLVLMLVPSVAAQTPMTACERRCSPPGDRLIDSTSPNAQADIFVYAHFLDLLVSGMLNTQPPSERVDPPLGSSLLAPTIVTETGTPADVRLEREVTMVPTLDHVRINENGQWLVMTGSRFFPLELGDGPIVLYVYVSHQAAPQGAVPETAGAAPRIRIEAVWEVDGTPWATGESVPFDMLVLPGEEHAYEVSIVLRPMERYIPGWQDGYDSTTRSQIIVRAVQAKAGVVEAGQPGVRFRAGHDLPWRIIMPVRNALEHVDVDVRRGEGGAILTWNMRSPFGPFDVDETTATLFLEGPTGEHRKLAPSRYEPGDMFSHNGLFQPVVLEWFVPDEWLDSGEGEATLRVRNIQGTYELVHTYEGAWPLLEAESVPGPTFVLAALAMLAFLRRR